MKTKRSFSQERQALIELMQDIRFGRIDALEVRDGEPVLNPPPLVQRDIVFGKTNAAHPARGADDFTVKDQILELFDLFDREPRALVERLVVQNGLPTRLTLAGTAPKT